jgi:hypothetical protein
MLIYSTQESEFVKKKKLDYVINRANRCFSSSSPECAIKLKKTGRTRYLGLEPTMYLLKIQISLKNQFLVLCYVATSRILLCNETVVNHEHYLTHLF